MPRGQQLVLRLWVWRHRVRCCQRCRRHCCWLQHQDLLLTCLLLLLLLLL
jgi:hypothetical protein